MVRDVRIDRLKSFARLLDDSIAIPGTNYRIGVDPILDLIPGVGDVIGLIASAYIILVAYQMKMPRAALARMAFNIAVDGLVGAAPLVGAVFDAGWKANLRNVALIERHAGQARTNRHDLWFLLLVLAALAAVCGAVGYAAIELLSWVIHSLR